MTAENSKLTDLASTLTFKTSRGEKPAPWGGDARHWRCTLTNPRSGNVYRFDFWQGVGHAAEPTAADCLECLLSDASSAGETFEDWCSELGENPDSRKAERTWKACQQVRDNLMRLLGHDFDTFMQADR